MNAHPYTESAMVEEAAIEILDELGWSTVDATREQLGPTGTLGRASAREVVLVGRLRAALMRLNPDASPALLDRAIDELTRSREKMGLAAANREVHRLLTEGITLDTQDARGAPTKQTLRVVDWDAPAANDWLAVRQCRVQGLLYACIPDVVLFVNGLPWVVIELKATGVPARNAFDDNLTSYKHEHNGVPSLFASNVLLIASNGTAAKVGSLTADWERFFEWKRVEREDEARQVSLEVMLKGTCAPQRLLDIARNFTRFSEDKGLVKIIAQNHQYLGVNNAIAALQHARRAGHGRAGVFWQTQGSGKSYAMVFFAEKILRTIPGDWTFVVVTDRVELDDQIARTFAACKAVEDATVCHAKSSAELRTLLSENHRYVFTLIQKFRTPEVLADRRDIVVMVDEAHRSQYDTLATNMRAALPGALFVAFTGTPLLAGEERTRAIFGDYVSIYDFQQSVEDGATVRLYYENRTGELQLTNPNLNDEIYAILDDAELDEGGEAQVMRKLGQRYHLITLDDRLDTIAEDIVQHFLGRGFQGKAMVVSIDKATALRMYDKVRRAWRAELERVKSGTRYGEPEDARLARVERIRRLESVDMAVVVSPGQNEIEDMKKLGLDIVPHRRRMVESKLDDRFKDPADPLALVFVCAMWLTGFDAPSCSTIYLDKPMRNHSLMQAIARANRVYPGKHAGVIVDYANVFESLERALSIYGPGGAGVSRRAPAHTKDELLDELARLLDALAASCRALGIDLAAIEAGKARERLDRIARAASTLLASEARRKDFVAQVRLTLRVFDAVKPHARASEFSLRIATLRTLLDKIHESTTTPVDVDEVLRRIGEVLGRSIAAVDIVEDAPHIDLSQIDFQALAARFKRSPVQGLDLARLQTAIRAQLDRMVAANPTRVDLHERFEALIDAYNRGSAGMEQLFAELLALSRTLDEEQTRHVREQLSDEELVVFDLLTRPGPELTPAQRNQVKQVARDLLGKVRTSLRIDWHKTAQSRAVVLDAIEETLDEGLPEPYTPELFRAKSGMIFQHVYERYGA